MNIGIFSAKDKPIWDILDWLNILFIQVTIALCV